MASYCVVLALLYYYYHASFFRFEGGIALCMKMFSYGMKDKHLFFKQ